VATLCKADEVVVFSCPTGKHIASVCASKAEAASGGYIQYRFGDTSKVDLSFPPDGTTPADVFTGGSVAYSGGGGAWLRFSNGAFRYNIFSAVGRWGRKGAPADAAGVFVERDGKNISNLVCRGRASGEMGLDFFKSRGILASDSLYDFDIPSAFVAD
jgi:hypothetical protein